MDSKKLFTSFACSALVTAILLSVFYFMAVSLQLRIDVLLWISFVMAIIGLIANIYLYTAEIEFGIHRFFLTIIPVSFGLLPLCFIDATAKWINGGAIMTVIAALHVVVSFMGFITHWQLTYEEFELDD